MMTQTAHAAERRRFTSISRHISHWADQILGVSYRKYSSAQAWIPAANLCEYGTHYCLILELAGMTAEEIDLRVEGGALILSGVRRPPETPDPSEPRHMHLMEIDHGQFHRAFELPEDVVVSRIEAKYAGGYLRVRIPKRRPHP
jgi:HSP20 family protein